MPDAITAVVVTWRGINHIEQCLRSLLDQTEPTRILVIDNASDDGTEQVLREFADGNSTLTVVRLDRNRGFAGGMDAALEHVADGYIALLNDDAIADPSWLAELRRPLDSEPSVAAATSLMLLVADGRVNNVGVGLTSSGYGFDLGLGDDPARHDQPREVFGFSGGAAMVRTAALRAAGGFPADFFLYYEDTDTAWRLRLKGWSVQYCPSALVRHIHSASAGSDRRSFAFYNERNRLWMLMRCAPSSLAMAQLLRFAVTTASLAGRSLMRRSPQGAHFSIRLRVAVLAATIRHLPVLVRERRSIGATRQQRRASWSDGRRLSR